MNKLKIFTKNDCPNCPVAKELGRKLEEEGRVISYYNIDLIEGLAESTYYDVLATPTIVLVDDKDKEVYSWRGEMPSLEKIKENLDQNEN